MAAARQGLTLMAVLLGVFVCTDMAAAQCGPTGATHAKNTACGARALNSVTTGTQDSAFGYNALESNTRGSLNTASGADALEFNTTGIANAASGTYALYRNTRGGGNTASGIYALWSNTTGSLNTANGDAALFYNTTGHNNTADGDGALESNGTGHYNIGLGDFAGSNIVGGSHNIDIGNDGADESNTIRIGTAGPQKKTYIAGISATQVTGNVVEVDSNGQLGIAMSSARYKRDIRNLGNASAGLMKLRPVSFRYKEDPSGALEYGLVAEEVQRVYPNLVTYGPDGKLQSVRYLEFTALLLKEVQKLTQRLETKDQQLTTQQRQLATQQHQLADQQHEIGALQQQNASINALSERLAALERQVPTASSQRLRSLASK